MTKLTADLFHTHSHPHFGRHLRLLFGRANEFKEGDVTAHLAARDEQEREEARKVLGGLCLGDVEEKWFMEEMVEKRERAKKRERERNGREKAKRDISPPASPRKRHHENEGQSDVECARDISSSSTTSCHIDELSHFLESALDPVVVSSLSTWTFNRLKAFLLDSPPSAIKGILPGLRSCVIAGVCKLCTDDELIQVAGKLYHSWGKHGTLGREGYFGSRIQPNSPTDDPEEVLFSVLEGT
jgi:ethanolamine ammonia-lyase large subunit